MQNKADFWGINFRIGRIKLGIQLHKNLNRRKLISKKWINGILTTLVAFVFVGSALGKFMADTEALKMAEIFGLDATTNYALGVIEIVAVLLFILPRTGILGTLLLAAYMGGAIATHLEHGKSVLIPCVIQAVLWTVALYRFPELGTRLLKGKS